MANKNSNAVNPAVKKYSKIGIIAAVVVAVAAVGIFALSRIGGKTVSVEKALSEVSTEGVNGADLRIAVVRMDAIQAEAQALKDLRKQKENYESKLRSELTSRQKALEKEKTEIEKSQDVLSREALQRRVVDYQAKVTKLQRDLTERAQAVEASYQKALATIQEKHLDPLIEGIIEKKNLSLVLDGRFARASSKIPNLDITNDVIAALNKKLSTIKMEKPKGF